MNEQALRTRFAERYGQSAAVIAAAPGRVNLIGDHTDYNEGFVLPAAIPQHTAVAAAFAPPGGSHEAISETSDEHVRWDEFNVASGFARYVRAGITVIEESSVTVPPLQLLVTSDVPVGAGLSSSASLEVALLRAIAKLLSLKLEPVELAMLAHRAEVVHVGVLCGIMDQMACSLATPDRMLYLDTRTLHYELLELPDGSEIVVLDSGTRRSLLTSGYNQRIKECEQAAAALGVNTLRDVVDRNGIERLPEPLRRRARYVVAENERVQQASSADARTFGELMGLSHAGLRDEFEVVVPAVDALVTALQRQSGCFGARMTGAGFGGACVGLVEKGNALQIGKAALAEARVDHAVMLIPSPVST